MMRRASVLFAMAVVLGATGAAAVANATFTAHSASLRRDTVFGTRLTLTMGCAGFEGQFCTGKIRLTAHTHTRGGKVIAVTASTSATTAQIAVGGGSFHIPVGGDADVPVTLSSAGMRLLRMFDRLPTTLSFSDRTIPRRLVTFRRLLVTARAGSMSR